MRLIWTLFILLMACGAKEKDPSLITMQDLKPKADLLCETFDIHTITRCDKITFAAMFASACKKNVVSDFEFPSGKWNRDVAPCYPDESQSETSLDGYISVLHMAKSLEDYTVPARIVEYAEPKDYITGEGPEGVTSILVLQPILYAMLGMSSKGETTDIPYITGFRAHLAASYLWLKRRVTGQSSELDHAALEGLWLANMGSPFFTALYEKSSNLDLQPAIDKLSTMPEEDSPYGWGSAPWQVYWLMTYEVLSEAY